MWRKGIYTREQFLALQRTGRLDDETVRISLQLLDIGNSAPTREDIDVFEGISRIFQTSNGVFRTTYQNRFEELDHFANRWIREIFPSDTTLIVEDRAASNALTSVEWRNSLIEFFPRLQLTASDILLHLIEATSEDGSTYILEPQGAALQQIRPPFVLPLLSKEARLLIGNRWMIRAARRKLAGLTLPAELRDDFRKTSVQSGAWRIRNISLVHPRARMLERKQSSQDSFRVTSGSIFDVSVAPCHVLREMNIVSTVNFTAPEISKAVLAAHSSLIEGGLWIVGKTATGNMDRPPVRHDASILQKRGSGFHLLERLGAGSEIEVVAIAV